MGPRLTEPQRLRSGAESHCELLPLPMASPPPPPAAEPKPPIESAPKPSPPPTADTPVYFPRLARAFVRSSMIRCGSFMKSLRSSAWLRTLIPWSFIEAGSTNLNSVSRPRVRIAPSFRSPSTQRASPCFAMCSSTSRDLYASRQRSGLAIAFWNRASSEVMISM